MSAVALAGAAITERGAARAVPGLASTGLPFARRSPKGRLRWYVVQVPEGRERTTCDKVRQLVPSSILDDAFVLYRERWMKRRGVWSLSREQMCRGYFFVSTRDALSLDRALAKLSFPVRLVGSDDRAWMPVSDEVCNWFSAALDGSHVIRSSTAEIVDGALRVINGPLVGQERRITQIDRHKRVCRVRIGDADGAFEERLPLVVPRKS